MNRGGAIATVYRGGPRTRLFPRAALKRAIRRNDAVGIRQALAAGAPTDGWRARGLGLDFGCMDGGNWYPKVHGAIEMALHHSCGSEALQALLDGGAAVPASLATQSAWDSLGAHYDAEYANHASGRVRARAAILAFWESGGANGEGVRRHWPRLEAFIAHWKPRAVHWRVSLFPLAALKRALRKRDLAGVKAALAAGAPTTGWGSKGPFLADGNIHGPGGHDWKVQGAIEMALHWANPVEVIEALVAGGAPVSEDFGDPKVNASTWQTMSNIYDEAWDGHVALLKRSRILLEGFWLEGRLAGATADTASTGRRAARL